jgi:hypothetical protein
MWWVLNGTHKELGVEHLKFILITMYEFPFQMRWLAMRVNISNFYLIRVRNDILIQTVG